MIKISKNKLKIFFLVIATGVTVFVVASYLSKSVSQKQKAEVIFLNVGQGDAILIQQNRMQILVDGGNGQEIMNRLGEVMPFADKKIDLVVMTHPDEDHMGGLVKVLENYKVGKIMEPGIACDKDMCKKWDELISQKHISVLDARLGQEIKFGDKIDISVLYPFENLSGKNFKNTNDSSLVLKADIDGKKYLLTGDAEDNTEKDLINSNLYLDADILKVGHHGSKYSTSAAFLQAVTPEKAVISVGENKYGHPTEEVLNRLKNMNIETLRTDQVGNVRF
jgi:competence protein ComEC